MRFEDIKKLATGTVLFDLKRIIAPRLVTIAYLLGLAAILLWAVNHFFYSFRFGFGNGLWGLLEIAVFGLLALIILRVACEAVIVYFKAHREETAEVVPVRPGATLIDDVRDAIEDLAEQEPDIEEVEVVVAPPPPPSARPASPPPPPPPAAPAAGPAPAAPARKRGRPAKPIV
ncbi:DUF4282 domain-containing protein [Pelagibacterium limicola]|uniref:DUF4282 domain-containing protein n=1 Tax=Pelagibacterium limicola TaxID=2791022 RepID=UPI0018AFFFA6|nr:DUF4282 domain-containing protein [Pelagibacterium limicola]